MNKCEICGEIIQLNGFFELVKYHDKAVNLSMENKKRCLGCEDK